MDIFGGSTYLSRMCARLLSMLAMLAVVVVTTITPAHAARMAGMRADDAAAAGMMMHAPSGVDPSCDGDRNCGSMDVEACEFVCAGLSVFLVMAGAEAGQAVGPGDHGFPAKAIHIGRAPGLNERPPKHRLS